MSLVQEYFMALTQALESTVVTDAKGAQCDLENGIEQAITLFLRQTRLGGKLMFIGNGASASISSHQAVDYWKRGGLRAMAFNDPTLLTCISNDFGYPHVFEKPIEMFANPNDVLVAISNSGNSPNILNAVQAARSIGCAVVTLSGLRPDNQLRASGALNFYVPAPEYGHVEIAHLAILHCIIDTIIEGGSV